ncbi:hypothetical protein [uncultured Streptomyces sp.]|uniref:hypothetical protein n=1 Tax=uncultured Streptomyces sp. TaxID=174707 RepID=UPI00262E9146|nr:hypothetical protein [uncultured Streptomyces sp.]
MEFRVLRGGLSRAVTVVALAAALATGSTGLLPAMEAHAAPATEGTFAFSGDEGDYISLGQSYAYATASQDRVDVYANADNSVVSLSVDGANGDWWYLNLAAPSGSALAPGTYAGATRHPFNGPSEPGLSLDGNGRGCNTLTGSFTIEAVEFGPAGYVETLDATFEQHCEGGVEAARGEVHIDNPEPPAALVLGLAVALQGTAGTLNGKATLHGSVSCSKPVRVDVSGDVTQVKKQKLIRGSYATVVNCVPGAPVAWSATAAPTGDVPFQRGDVEVEARATAIDPDYDESVSAAETVAVHLARG